MWYTNYPMNISNFCHNRLNYLSYIFFFFSFFFLFFIPSFVQAADPKLTIRDEAGYSAKYVSQSIADPISVVAGETKTVTIRFKNTGTESWNASGARYVSAYTVEPRDRKSIFTNNTWKSALQTNAITKITKPGEVAELTVKLTAPSTPGTYTEEFHLAAENYSWIKGGYFYLKLVVVPGGSNTVQTPPVNNSNEASTTPAVAANRNFKTASKITAKGGEQISYTLSYKNIGTEDWSQSSVHVESDDNSLFADTSWLSKNIIYLYSQPVASGDFLRKKFVFRAPPQKGIYNITLKFVTNGVVVGETVLPVTVTEDAPSSYKVVRLQDDFKLPEVDNGESETPRLSQEPYIRVGLFVVSTTVRVEVEDDYRLVVDGIDVATLSSGKSVRLTRTGDGFVARIGVKNYAGVESLVLIPKNDKSAVFTITSYNRMVTWKGPKNFNAYRGKLEMRKGEKSDDVWVVNELLLSDYAKGISENSNGSPMEYLKAQSVAQVSYAYAIMQSNKYGIFDVVATTGDQLYLGYNSELLMPRFVQAAESVRGYMVSYNNEPVITPYFANTNGKTKSWTSVWGGSVKPWLVPVIANYDVGKKLFGHGVGMSQLDAAARADKEGLSWKELLAYYYTGTKVIKMFE